MNTLFTAGPLALWLLLVGLFFPRLALFVAWLSTGSYPPNTLPVLLNFVSWLFIPRFLMAYYVYTDMGTANFWFWAYLVTGVVGLFGESGLVHRKIIRRTKVTGNGETTTTVEEEVS